MRYSFLMENLHHDTHQFYFERYLRNKLSAEDRRKLEQRIGEDEELRAAFEHYKQNRRQLVKELIAEHDKGPRKGRFTYIYLAITIAGLILALNFYLENQSLLAERRRDKNLISRLLDNIPFVGKKNKEKEEPSAAKKTNRPKVVTPEQDVPEQEQGEESISEEPVAEVLLHDTVLVPISRKYIEQRFTFYRTEIDTNLTDEEILGLIYRNNHKYPDKHKSAPVGVEFRNDAAKGTGYLFDGHKLVVFGVQAPYRLMLVKDENELVWIQPDGEVILNADSRFHTY